LVSARGLKVMLTSQAELGPTTPLIGLTCKLSCYLGSPLTLSCEKLKATGMWSLLSSLIFSTLLALSSSGLKLRRGTSNMTLGSTTSPTS